jgi:hypothetical protein
LSQLAAMKKDASAMFMFVRHGPALVRRREVCYLARNRWLTQTANTVAESTSIIVAMGRFVCHVRIVGTTNPTLSHRLSANSNLLLTVPSAEH